MSVVTRFAPSPTGFLHIGSVRTALYSYALAKKNGGKFILRIEDTDKKREVKGSIEDIINGLKLFGLDFDEGPIKGGPNGPYIQSERLDIYQKKAEELVRSGHAYYCFCSSKRLAKIREQQQKEKKQPMYDRKCRGLALQEIQRRLEKGEKYVIRLKVPDNRKLSIEDKILGKIEWDSNTIDDQILLKSDGYPTYHLGVVVDDVLMGMTHITRGFEWLASVPKHILLFEAFQYKIPVMAHLPLILDPGGGKLSKRRGTVSVEGFMKEGYIPEALLNFLMLLGWAPGNDQEIFSLKEFVNVFELESLNKANPVFDRQKLLWFNGQYIRKYSLEEFSDKVRRWVEEYCDEERIKECILEDEKLNEKLKLIQERVSLLSEVVDMLRFFYQRLDIPNLISTKGVKKYCQEDFVKIAQDYLDIVTSYDSNSSRWEHEKWEKDIRTLADKYDWKHGDLFMFVRLLIVGSPVSPPLFEAMVILGKKESVRRIEKMT